MELRNVLLGIAVWKLTEGTDQTNNEFWNLGLNGAMFQMLAHGISRSPVRAAQSGVDALTSVVSPTKIGVARFNQPIADRYDLGAILPPGLTAAQLQGDLTLQYQAFGQGLNPHPPNLVHSAGDMAPNEIGVLARMCGPAAALEAMSHEIFARWPGEIVSGDPCRDDRTHRALRLW